MKKALIIIPIICMLLFFLTACSGEHEFLGDTDGEITVRVVSLHSTIDTEKSNLYSEEYFSVIKTLADSEERQLISEVKKIRAMAPPFGEVPTAVSAGTRGFLIEYASGDMELLNSYAVVHIRNGIFTVTNRNFDTYDFERLVDAWAR